MQADQERIEVSRYQKRIDNLEATVKELKQLSAASARAARLSNIERQLTQLQAEGYEVDRPKLMDRFSKKIDNMTDEDVTEEITLFRDHFKRSPVGQEMIFGLDMGDESTNIISDNGGNNPDRRRDPVAAAYQSISEHASSNGIYGEETVRFAREKVKMNGDEGPMGTAVATVERFRKEKHSK